MFLTIVLLEHVTLGPMQIIEPSSWLWSHLNRLVDYRVWCQLLIELLLLRPVWVKTYGSLCCVGLIPSYVNIGSLVILLEQWLYNNSILCISMLLSDHLLCLEVSLNFLCLLRELGLLKVGLSKCVCIEIWHLVVWNIIGLLFRLWRAVSLNDLAQLMFEILSKLLS